jgi:peptidoglycan/xylan/chitin deacetylase (PgdA/CDA1 family)
MLGPFNGSARPPLVLAYHGIANVPLRRDRHFLFVRPSELGRHIRVLRSWGYSLVSFGHLARLVRDGRAAGCAALTFDDGLADNLHVLLPLVRRFEVAATVFVVSGWLGGSHPDATWARILTPLELRELHAAGMEIGSHTATHPSLIALDYDSARAELERGRVELEEVIDAPVRVAAYPYGEATADTVRACAAAGFVAAAALGTGSWQEPLNLPRQHVAPGMTRAALWLKREDRYNSFVARPPGQTARKLVHRLKLVIR